MKEGAQPSARRTHSRRWPRAPSALHAEAQAQLWTEVRDALCPLSCAQQDCPSASRQIDLFPSSANRFVGTGRGQDEEGQSLLRVAGLGSQRLKERRGILVRQCRMMFDALHFGSFGQQMIQVSLPACGILASPIAANGRPVQDGFDPAAYPRGSFCLRLPDRLKYLEYERVSTRETVAAPKTGLAYVLRVFVH